MFTYNKRFFRLYQTCKVLLNEQLPSPVITKSPDSEPAVCEIGVNNSDRPFIVATKIRTMNNNTNETIITPDIHKDVLDEIICPGNEAILSYDEDSEEYKKLKQVMDTILNNCEDVPIVIGEKEYRTNLVQIQSIPFNHSKNIAKFHYADEKLIQTAIIEARAAQLEWDRVSYSTRFEIWQKAINLMRNKYRSLLNAATILGQAKTIYQAEIDSACELIDFFNFHSYFMKEALKYQPISEPPMLNTWKHRGFNGFVAAITPFNFTAIAGNLAYTPALAGNGVVWKPSNFSMLSNWYIYKICREAGVPAGLVNFVPADGAIFAKVITKNENLAGINFTGSSEVFKKIWKSVAENLDQLKFFPRVIGECGGKNYHFVYEDADLDQVANDTINAAFEYSGQKCSACSRLYVPDTVWIQLKEKLLELHKKLIIGSPQSLNTFTSAVIHKQAFDRIKSYIDYAKGKAHLEVLCGGDCKKTEGYYITPTIVETKDPKDKLMIEEIFGPLLTVYVYQIKELTSVLELVKNTTKYALTGSLYSKNDAILKFLFEELKYTAGNFYINHKCTGSVVGQQPFGGSGMSGTNDKAGGPNYVLRFTNPLVIKEYFSYKK